MDLHDAPYPISSIPLAAFEGNGNARTKFSRQRSGVTVLRNNSSSGRMAGFSGVCFGQECASQPPVVLPHGAGSVQLAVRVLEYVLQVPRAVITFSLPQMVARLLHTVLSHAMDQDQGDLPGFVVLEGGIPPWIAAGRRTPGKPSSLLTSFTLPPGSFIALVRRGGRRHHRYPRRSFCSTGPHEPHRTVVARRGVSRRRCNFVGSAGRDASLCGFLWRRGVIPFWVNTSPTRKLGRVRWRYAAFTSRPQ